MKQLPRRILQIVSEIHIKVRHELKQGRYDWFRPFLATHYHSEMIRTNRDLQIVVDNGSIVRGGKTRQMKAGKILTFQGNQPIMIPISASNTILESIDRKGVPFVEYDYTGAQMKERTEWMNNSYTGYRFDLNLLNWAEQDCLGFSQERIMSSSCKLRIKR